MESTDSSGGSPRRQQPNLPPGFRFHPTDEELVVHYLKKKAVSLPLPVSIIAEVDLYKFDPWELPAKATFGEQEWYFFSPRDRKYPNGARPNRAATSGYWKATGTDKPVLTSGGTQKVGVKKALVFYGGKPPKGIKTNWIMHEYRLADNKPNNGPPGYLDPANKKNSLRLDDWVLCRIYKKSTASRPLDHHHHRHHHGRDLDLDLDHDHHDQYHNHHHHDSILSSDDVFGGPMNNNNNISNSNTDNNNNPLLRMISVLGPQNSAAVMNSYGGTMLTENDHQMFDGMLSSTNTTAAATATATANKNGSTEYGSAEAETEARNAAASSSLASLLSQPALNHGQQQTVLGALGDGIFQRSFPLPGMNWYS